MGYAQKVQREGTPELAQAVERGKVAVSLAATTTGLPEDKQALLASLGLSCKGQNGRAAMDVVKGGHGRKNELRCDSVSLGSETGISVRRGGVKERRQT